MSAPLSPIDRITSSPSWKRWIEMEKENEAFRIKTYRTPSAALIEAQLATADIKRLHPEPGWK